jgi:hypothetical protein
LLLLLLVFTPASAAASVLPSHVCAPVSWESSQKKSGGGSLEMPAPRTLHVAVRPLVPMPAAAESIATWQISLPVIHAAQTFVPLMILHPALASVAARPIAQMAT